VIGRATQGVRVINLKEGDRVVSLARIPGTDEADEQTDAQAEPEGDE